MTFAFFYINARLFSEVMFGILDMLSQKEVPSDSRNLLRGGTGLQPTLSLAVLLFVV